ncbi:MAG: hypothetical protein WDM88_12255 [Galbitalea sp.]
MTHGADEKLARVTYLPGVLPPAAVPVEPLATASVVPPVPVGDHVCCVPVDGDRAG